MKSNEFELSLRAARINCNLTVKEAAAGLEVSPWLLTRWEHDKDLVPSGMIVPIANYYKTPIGLIFSAYKAEKNTSFS